VTIRPFVAFGDTAMDGDGDVWAQGNRCWRPGRSGKVWPVDRPPGSRRAAGPKPDRWQPLGGRQPPGGAVGALLRIPSRGSCNNLQHVVGDERTYRAPVASKVRQAAGSGS
jgi:hypothetical protein